MNLQFRKGFTRLASLAMVAGVATAHAQVATHTQLGFSSSDHHVTLTATVGDSVGNPATDGVVSFENAQGQSLGSAFVNNGRADVVLDQPASGSVYAVYSGSQGFRGSTAQGQLSSDATSTVPDFSITANPASLSVSPGQFGTIVLTITPLNGFANMVTLSCSGNPTPSTCTFSPATLTPLNGNPTTSSLQIITQGPAGARLAWPAHNSKVALALLPGILALIGLGAIRKRSGVDALSILGIAALLAAGSLGLTACAQRYDYLHHPPAANKGIAPGNYNITIAAFSNNGATVTSHTLTVTLMVK
ncbi:MAG TPA: hypothetical protein VFW25_13630 [Silvibacterium sp.]|nr:hypothetical protein [Silvibacterium sp.]